MIFDHGMSENQALTEVVYKNILSEYYNEVMYESVEKAFHKVFFLYEASNNNGFNNIKRFISKNKILM